MAARVVVDKRRAWLRGFAVVRGRREERRKEREEKREGEK